ncbi:MAG: sugar kinase [Candidatus Tectomicrobia bacterium]|uniref:Sugar kinase n=1 Tax=Tectimicrobiota bacterium TaxID=2528274 RepID=A0A932FV59_UNCTE|nr:sugar kinase [Candidatus Tectomicrobia bacterium]
MSLLVVGSVALDSVKTPFGQVEEALGGSGTYFSVAASYFSEVSLVAVVGTDFPEEHLQLLRERNVDLEGLQRVRGQSFRWRGEYGYDLNEAKTLDTQLNVFQTFKPALPETYRDARYVFLANIDPELQQEVLDQVRAPALVACDTMNFWIERKLEALKETLKRVDILIINESEAREMAREANIVKAAKTILSWGPRSLVIKRGEYGALRFSDHEIFSAPGFPLELVYDPTGAGDSFAGGFMGYLANDQDLIETQIRRAIIFGSTMASFNVEDFSLNRLRSLTFPEIEKRYRAFKGLAHFEDL